MKTMKQQLSIAALLAAATIGMATASPLPPGTPISGTASGASSLLLGLDHGFADEAGTGITALAADDLEYLTGDYAVAIDFFTDGSLLVYNNSDTTRLPGSYSLSFSFGGLAQALTGVNLVDLSGISGGTVSAQLLSDHSFSISFSNLSTHTEFGSFSAQLNFAPVPEPASAALLLAGLGLLAGARRLQQDRSQP